MIFHAEKISYWNIQYIFWVNLIFFMCKQKLVRKKCFYPLYDWIFLCQGGRKILRQSLSLSFASKPSLNVLSVDIPCIKNLNAIYLNEYFTYDMSSSVSNKDGVAIVDRICLYYMEPWEWKNLQQNYFHCSQLSDSLHCFLPSFPIL